MSTPPGPDLVIDGEDRLCVALLLELRQRITGLPDGTLVHLITTDPGASLDLPAWCYMTGHEYLGRVWEDTDRPTYALRVNAHSLQTLANRPWHFTE